MPEETRQFSMFDQFQIHGDDLYTMCVCTDCLATVFISDTDSLEDVLEWAWQHIEDCGH